MSRLPSGCISRCVADANVEELAGFVYAASTNTHKSAQAYMHISPGALAL